MRATWSFIRVVVAGLLAVAMLVVLAPTVSAQGDGEVFADGLNGPMGVLVDANGDVWVADSGLGGDGEAEVIDPETGETLAAGFGPSAQIVKISGADGSMSAVGVVASLATSEGATGGNRLALVGDQLYASVGEWEGEADSTVPDGMAQIVAIGSDGTAELVASMWDYERDNNLYPPVLHSHPFGMAAAADGTLLVVEAGGNSLLRLDPTTGAIEPIAVFESLPGVFPRPDLGGELLTDPVPTGVVASADGGAYVSLLSGAPFVPGSAKVLHVAADGTVSDYATGLTMLTDLRMGPDGNLYGVQFAVFGEQGPGPTSGAVVKIVEGEGSTPVIEGLSFPTSLDFDADGNAYVAVNGVGAPGSGQIMKYAGLASSGGTGDTGGTGGELPNTGAETALIILFGVSLLAAGMMFINTGRNPISR